MFYFNARGLIRALVVIFHICGNVPKIGMEKLNDLTVFLKHFYLTEDHSKESALEGSPRALSCPPFILC